jgi:hypothetical protein
MLSIREISKSDQKIWDDYVLGHPKGLAYQLYAWKEAIERAYGFECHYFIAQEEEIVRGVFPLARIHLPFCIDGIPTCINSPQRSPRTQRIVVSLFNEKVYSK